MTLLAIAAPPTVYACPMHPDVTAETPGKCPQCGMKLLPARSDQATGGHHEHGAMGEHHEHAAMHEGHEAHGGHGHDHAAAGGIEWEDDMVEVNRITTPANTRWKLIDRSTGAENHGIRVAVHGRRPGEDPAGQRDGLRPPDASPVPHPRRGPLPRPGPRRSGGAEPDVEGHRAGAHRRGRGHPARRHQPGPVDGALPHRRAPRERDDVQLRRRSRGRRHDAAVRCRRGRWRAGRPGDRLSPRAAAAALHDPGSRGQPAAAWRERWDSLELFTPVRYDSLPGLAFPGDPDTYPGRDDVVAYLTDYARRFELPVELNSRVRAVQPTSAAATASRSTDRVYEADQVVIATGPFQVPRIPPVAADLDPGVVQFHSTEYRSPRQIPAGPVLVVGGGNTGYQIAEELSRDREVHLSIGSRQTPLPQRILGRDLFTYLEAARLMRVTAASRLGRRLQHRETLIGSSPRAARRRHGIHLHGRTEPVQGAAGDVRRRREGGAGRGDLGDRVRARSLARDGAGVRRDRARRPPARRHGRARPVLPRAAVAAHPRLGAARLGEGRRGVHRAAHRGARRRSRGAAGARTGSDRR